MKNSDALKAEISRRDSGAHVWEIVLCYLCGEYGQFALWCKLVNYYDGDQAAADAIGRALGIIGPEEVLDAVFGQLCLGK